jgi:6-phosphogluconolactonase
VEHKLQVAPDANALAAMAASYLVSLTKAAVVDRGRFTFAVSGGHTPWDLFAALRAEYMPWPKVELFQVDERIAPDGDPDRNLTHLLQSIGDVAARVLPMPVTDADPDAAADAYAAVLPQRFDLVHLGLGPDGHTASLVPGDPVLDVSDKLVAMTQPYQGHRRMTLTYPALARAGQLLWLVTGPDKKDALAKLLAGDESIPASRVQAGRSLIMADESAVP